MDSSAATPSLDEILAPVSGEANLSEPPPELRMKEVVIAPRPSVFPSWAVAVLIVSMTVAVLLALTVSFQFRLMVKLKKQIDSLQAQVGTMGQSFDEQKAVLQAMQRKVGGLANDVSSINEDSLIPTEAPEPGFEAGDEEPPTNGERPVTSGRDVGGVLPGGVWTGGF
ncbi:MAG: hypothetical protein ABI743_11875, partial [bacterium]